MKLSDVHGRRGGQFNLAVRFVVPLGTRDELSEGLEGLSGPRFRQNGIVVSAILKKPLIRRARGQAGGQDRHETNAEISHEKGPLIYGERKTRSMCATSPGYPGGVKG